jgi:hypothetical protein
MGWISRPVINFTEGNRSLLSTTPEFTLAVGHEPRQFLTGRERYDKTSLACCGRGCLAPSSGGRLEPKRKINDGIKGGI